MPLEPKKKLRQSLLILLQGILSIEFLLGTYSPPAYATFNLYPSGDLGVSPSHASWISTIYFAGQAFGLFLGPWFDRFLGRVRALFFAISFFALFDFLVAVSSDYYLSLFFRLLLGIAGGSTMTLCQLNLLDYYPINRWPFITAYFGFLQVSVFGFGPVLGGFINEYFGWRAYFLTSFSLHVICGLIASWIILFLSDQHPEHETKEVYFDWVGFILILFAALCFQTIVTRGQDEDWYNSTFIDLLFIFGSVSLVYFIVWEIGEKKPFINIKLFLKPTFIISAIIAPVTFAIVYGLFSTLVFNLQLLKNATNFSSFQAGLAMAPLLFFLPFLYPSSVFLSQRIDPRLIASILLTLLGIFCYWTGYYDFFRKRAFFDQFFNQYILLTQVLNGAYVGLVAPLNAIGIHGLSKKNQESAINSVILLRTYFLTWGGGLLGTMVMEHRRDFQQTRLVETFSGQNPESMQFISSLHQLGLNDLQIHSKLVEQAANHSVILALNDTYRLCSWIYFFLALLVWLPSLKKAERYFS
ncbi:MFS transporter [Methylacidiphilum caldifontis]|uniref:MFS transporter n=1 Tax=Methylacidiphilum caldifontis TaxID=2795386 RepID=UPI001A8CBDA3|nr:MFS transporter [Methylacidiphilum caldifontis]QSR89102.1 MFS transporter [Methylacidiphilum caldifontis]